nr:(Fe-S)-binding protein [Desulfobacterales bacterium]
MFNVKKKEYLYKKDYEAPVRDLLPKEFEPDYGITKVNYWTPPEVSRYEDLEYYRFCVDQCIKCACCRLVAREWDRICPSGELGAFESYYASGKNLLIWGLLRDEIELTEEIAKIFYHCTLCGNCTQQCAVPHIHGNMVYWFEAFREKAVAMGIGPLPEHKEQAVNIDAEHNPYGEPHTRRLDWLPFSVEDLPDKAEIVFFAGCTDSYLEKRAAQSMVEILKKAGVDFTISKDERCCGMPLQRTGQTAEAKERATYVVEDLHRLQPKIVVTNCAGCYRMLKEDYPNRYGMKLNFEVVPSASLVLDLIEKGNIKLKKNGINKITYHDPCELGRLKGVYESPREVLAKIPGVELIEMKRNRE